MAQLRTGLRWGFGMLVALGMLGMPSKTVAQPVIGGVMKGDGTGTSDAMAGELSPPILEPRTFGTASTVAHTLQAFAFIGIDSATTYTGAGQNGALACTGAICTFLAPVLLPAGARVTAIELEGCDIDLTANVIVTFIRRGPIGATFPPPPPNNLASAGTAGAAGCTRVMQALAVPETIDNLNSSYYVQASTGPTDGTRLYAVRIFYSLQVSPAPGAASFFDVPTSHQFFRFIEALARSGITSGCGNGNFCPDAALTRGQMAVFLSLGLGLHFAP